MLETAHPEALLLVPLWLAAVWFFPKARLLRPGRVAVGLLLMLSWMNPRVPRQSRGLDVWMMVDRSLSAADWIEPRLPEMQTLLEQSRGPRDRLFFIDFAEDVIERIPHTETILSGRMDATNIGEALQFTLAKLDPGRHARLLLITDGYATDPLEDAALQLARSAVPLDLRLISPADATDFRVDDLIAPLHVRPGEAFLLEARIHGTSDTGIPVELLRDGRVIARATATLRRGRATLRWSETLSRPGAVEYQVRIHPENDAWEGNNQQTRWVEARGGRRALLVTPFPDDPVASALRDAGLEVDVFAEPSRLRPGHLAGVSTVLLNNVPAQDLPVAFIDALPFFVREQGGGLVMFGGRASFGAGGYFQSPVDELLPVSMELKQEHRKLSVAVAIVMDRSGSMNAGVPGAPGMTKMGLANEGAAQAIELLGDMDAVTVFAVDTQPHVVVPLTTLGENRDQITSMVRRIQSSGGGIYVYEGLKAGWEELQKSTQGQRHIILFTDASDSERPEGYERIVDDMLAQNATLSIIALGNERDIHGDLLKEIAARAGASLLFNDDASALPAIFSQETVAMSRSAFLDEPVEVLPAAGWRELAAASLDWPGTLDGYNLSYLRPEAAASLLTGDEYEAPLLAHWTRGVGRVAAVSFPVSGDSASLARAWPSYGDFLRTVVGWTLREELPPGLALRRRRVGETLVVELHHDQRWEDAFARVAPELVTVSGANAEPIRHTWTRVAPGVFSTSLELGAETMLRGSLRVGDLALPFGPVSAAAGAEWRFDPAMPRALRHMSEVSGGVNRVDLASIWNAPRRVEYTGIRDLLLIALLVVFLAEALWTRLDGQKPGIDFSKAPSLRSRWVPKNASSPQTPVPGTEEEPPVKRREIFQRARRK